VAGIGGAAGGSPWSSSPNPAATGLHPPVGKRACLGASAQYALAAFDEGTRVEVAALSVAHADRRLGVFQPSAFAAWTNHERTSDGLGFEWEAEGAELQWGRQVAPGTAVGLNLGFVDSQTRLDLDGLPVTRSDTTTWSVRAGVIRQFRECTAVGFSAEWSHAPSDATVFDFMGPGSGDLEVEDTTNGLVLRPGVYTFLTKDLTLYADYVFARYENDAGALVSHRGEVGLDLTVREGVYLRGGAVLDRWGNFSFAAGLGLAFSEDFLLDFSWQYNQFPEIEREFGRSHTFGIGVTVML
jgi:hypothetical protein